jgi:hypothetical protein
LCYNNNNGVLLKSQQNDNTKAANFTSLADKVLNKTMMMILPRQARDTQKRTQSCKLARPSAQ